MSEVLDDASFVPGLLQELRRNFFTHVTKDVAFRKQQLKNLLKGHAELKEEFDEALKKDLGYTPFLSFFLSHNITRGEVEHTLNHLDQWVKPTPISLPIIVGMGKSYVQPEPLGVALVLGAWNYPVYLLLPFTAVAIAAGNCVIAKPSEFAPYSSHVLKKLYDKYLDPRFYRCVEGKVEVGRALTNSKVDLILFTGSTQIGMMVAQAAAKNLIPCVLELGGKCPTIIDRTANIPGAAKRVAMGRFMNSGQTCIAADHLFVHNSIKKEFMEVLIATSKELYGDNVESNPDMGKIINIQHVQRLERYLKEEHGGKVLLGGKVFPENQFIQPTIINEPREDCSMMRDEIFGPILPVFGYD
jgi:aldehyde dehydrogenase (NAD+)